MHIHEYVHIYICTQMKRDPFHAHTYTTIGPHVARAISTEARKSLRSYFFWLSLMCALDSLHRHIHNISVIRSLLFAKRTRLLWHNRTYCLNLSFSMANRLLLSRRVIEISFDPSNKVTNMRWSLHEIRLSMIVGRIPSRVLSSLSRFSMILLINPLSSGKSALHF